MYTAPVLTVSVPTDRQAGHSGAKVETELVGKCANSLPIQSDKGFTPYYQEMK